MLAFNLLSKHYKIKKKDFETREVFAVSFETIMLLLIYLLCGSNSNHWWQPSKPTNAKCPQELLSPKRFLFENIQHTMFRESLPILSSSAMFCCRCFHRINRMDLMYNLKLMLWLRDNSEIFYRENLNPRDRKSTRLNSSHLVISYAVFCLKKKKNIIKIY